MSEEIALDALTGYLQSQDKPLGYNTLAVQDEEHPILGSLLKEWAKHDALYGSLDVPFGELKVDGGYLRHSRDKHRSFPIDGGAARALGTSLDIPTKYLDRIAGTELFEGNVNYWLNRFGESEATVVYKSDDGTISEIVDADVFRKRLPRIKVVKTIAEVIGDDQARVREVFEDMRSTTIKISSPVTTIAPSRRVGDITEAGIMLRLPKGISAPVLSVYLHRLVCTNGMTSTDNKYKVEIKGLDADEILGNVKDVGALVWERAKKLLHGVAVLDDEKIAQPRYMVSIFAREMGLDNRTTQYAMELVADFVDSHPGYDFTRYDLVQLMTAIAHDSRIKQNARNSIAEGAGFMVAAAADEHRCDSCHQLVPTSVH